MTSRLASALMSLVPYVDGELKKEIYEFLPTLLKQTKEIQLDSDSSGGGEYQEPDDSSPPVIEEEDSDSFLVPDDKILKTYSDKDLFSKSKKPSRKIKKRSTFDPSEYHDEQEDDEIIELNSEDDRPDKVNRDALKLFLKALADSDDKIEVISESHWFQQQFGDVIDEVTAQMGRDSDTKHQKALEAFRLIAEACLLGLYPTIETTMKDGICNFCTEKRPSNTTISMYNKSYFVGSQCAELMKRSIAFFNCLGETDIEDYDQHFKKLKKLLADIPLGNAMKKNRGKDPDEGKIKRRKTKGGRRRK